MKSLIEFLRSFFQNQGQFVFVSLFIAKVCAFLGSLVIVWLLPKSEFGTLSIIISVFSVFVPLSGFGSPQSLLRYGSITQNIEEKKLLSGYLFKTGFFYQVILTLLFFCTILFFKNKFEGIWMMMLFFSIRLFGFYFFMHIQSEKRIFGDNKQFAKINNVVNISGLILLIVLTYFFGFKGYLISIAIPPFLSLLWLDKDRLENISEKISVKKQELFNYGIHAASTALLSDLLYALDIFLIGFLMNELAVADYKVAILIPANITFLSLVFMQTDFPKIAKNYSNKTFLKNYISNYYKIFIPVCLLIFSVSLFFGEEILALFFGSNYKNNATIFIILIGAFCLNILFRNLYGNLLSAVGKIRINTVLSLLSLPILVLLSFIFVPKFEVLGMGISMGLTLFFTSIFLAISFYGYLSKLK